MPDTASAIDPIKPLSSGKPAIPAEYRLGVVPSDPAQARWTATLSTDHGGIDPFSKAAVPPAWDRVPVLLLGDRYVASGNADAACGRLDLASFLKERFDFDAHVAQYLCPASVRLRKVDHDHVPVEFHVFLFDIDRHGEEPAEPPNQYLCFLVWNTFLWRGPVPNFCYTTRNGVRLGYVLKEPITDRTIFEAKYRRLWKAIHADLCAAHHAPYRLDPATRDWTRLFRGRDVVRTDKPYDGADAHLCVIHRRPLDPRKLRVDKPKPPFLKRRQPGNGSAGDEGSGGDVGLYALAFERKRLCEGTRNVALNRSVFTLYRFYSEGVADKVLDRLIAHAVVCGLPEREAQATAGGAKRRGMCARERGDE